ncbi:hypothetical protein WCV21_02785 [Lactobacillus helveticus]|uniref:Uncharacterized protein n=1 Tax=Lactobacillus helveticus CIRM-BIA 951 TaxID=1226334 RepID=U6F3M1_LACHE|nr:hypothetical protein [Lactobacillus helveticus]MDY0991004.1 hypothetical protein [Lactobacillus helveticus]MDY1001684.1 hypothetical protein [Lactobacillus helveticus]MEB2873525.1 hypothetical protein [Lactobacillus helveticus]NRO48518.1 hypothetical protein [Lactobacillus helveticus]NRO82002.1 hypothetical protein [Lactobacillus helveticus]
MSLDVLLADERAEARKEGRRQGREEGCREGKLEAQRIGVKNSFKMCANLISLMIGLCRS